VVWLASNSNVL